MLLLNNKFDQSTFPSAPATLAVASPTYFSTTEIGTDSVTRIVTDNRCHVGEYRSHSDNQKTKQLFGGRSSKRGEKSRHGVSFNEASLILATVLIGLMIVGIPRVPMIVRFSIGKRNCQTEFVVPCGNNKELGTSLHNCKTNQQADDVTFRKFHKIYLSFQQRYNLIIALKFKACKFFLKIFKLENQYKL